MTSHVKTHKFLQFFRLLCLIIHFVSGLLQSFIYPHVNRRTQRYMAKKWAQRFLRILNIKLHYHGSLPSDDQARVILAANHISWLDVIAILAIYPVRFVAKSEILDWPIIGKLSANAGTIFVAREKRNDTLRVNQFLSEILIAGDRIAIFPEGTTSDGTHLLHFHASLLQFAVASKGLVYPVAIHYRDAMNQPTTLTAYVDVSITQSLQLILQQPSCHVELNFLTPLQGEEKNRRELARLTEHAISHQLALPVVRKGPEKSSDLPIESQ